MYAPRSSACCPDAKKCTSGKDGKDGKPGQSYIHQWTLGDPTVPGEFSFEEISFRSYTFNLIDGEGNDATVWFETIKTLFPYARVVFSAIDTNGGSNIMGVLAVQFNPNNTVTVQGGVLVSAAEIAGKTFFSYTISGAPRVLLANVETLTAGSASVTFSPPFPNVPNVQATINSPVSATVSASAITSTGFTLTVTPAPTVGDPVQVSWLAIYN